MTVLAPTRLAWHVPSADFLAAHAPGLSPTSVLSWRMRASVHGMAAGSASVVARAVGVHSTLTQWTCR
eukprot:357473-Chlamydomonas_euryale.AAC.8